ncbi:MAG: HD domain-containing protein [Ruminococcaceae bacterium]|nr:HD domain-containing protein [Oscillospiraceae bacterium]
MVYLSEKALYIIDTLNKNGFEAFAVGGCIRDMLMGIPAHDCDITTNAKTEDIFRIFKDHKTLDTGAKHGTVTVILENEALEVTTYRLESTYSDNRHPDTVRFTKNLTDDLARRDFTVNSIAYSPSIGIIDPFDGIKDIEKRLIRCVGNPSERFNEDSLRILRGLRFSSVLGFEIEQETSDAMHKCRHLIKNLSKERVFSELSKLLCGKNVRCILVSYPDIFGEIIPEISVMEGFDQHNFHHIHDVLTHTAVVTESTPPLVHLRLAALFHDSAKPFCFETDKDGIGHFYGHAGKSAEIAEKRLTDLRCDNKTKEAVVRLIKAHDAPIEESEKIIKRRLASMGKDLFFDLIKLKRADTAGLAPEFSSRSKHFDRLEEMAREIISQDDCFSLKKLDINGNDLMALGFKGKEIGEKLQMLLEAVIDGKAENKKDALIKYIYQV